jgi:hypothetical protein
MIHNHAPRTLIRSAMENAATAVWLLEPRQRGERLRRRLKLAHDEAKEAGQVHKLFPAEVMAGKRPAQERVVEIRSLAIHLGLDPDDVVGRFSYEKVVRMAGEATRLGVDLSALVWRLGRGFAHGRYWASMFWLQREVVDASIARQLLGTAGSATSMRRR